MQLWNIHKPNTSSLPSEDGLLKEPSVVGSEDIPQNIDYSSYSLDELKKEAKSRGIEGYSKLKKAELIEILSK